MRIQWTDGFGLDHVSEVLSRFSHNGEDFCVVEENGVFRVLNIMGTAVDQSTGERSLIGEEVF